LPNFQDFIHPKMGTILLLNLIGREHLGRHSWAQEVDCLRSQIIMLTYLVFQLLAAVRTKGLFKTSGLPASSFALKMRR